MNGEDLPEFVVPDDLSAWLDGDAGVDELPSQRGEHGSVGVIATIDLLTPGAPYVTEVQPADDVSISLPGDKAIGYAMAVLAAAHRAHYFAAVLAQARALMGRSSDPMARLEGDEHAKFILENLVQDLPELDQEATAPLRFVPVIKKDGTGAVRASLPPHDVPLTGWSFAEACSHAHAVLDQAVVSHLDTAYRNVISVTFGVGEQKGRAMVGTLTEFFEVHPSATDAGERVPFVKPSPRVPGPPPGARPGGKKRRR